MGKRANGEGSLYKTIQKQDRKEHRLLEECNICRNCKTRELCNNRVGTQKCKKCKECKECLNYCDRFYCKEIWIGQATVQGKQKTLSSNQKQHKAKEKKDKILKKLENGTYKSNSNVTLYDLASEIIEDRYSRNKTGQNAYNTNKCTLKRIGKSDFTHIPISKLTDNNIKTYLDNLTEESSSLIKKDYGLINSAFDRAVPSIIPKNPFDREEFKIPRSKKKTKTVIAFTISEQRKFINVLKDEPVEHRYKWAWLLSLYTGMRIGEVYAINKDLDIDFQSNKIYVNSTLTKDENDKIILGDRTKTYSGQRTIKIDAMIKFILNKAIEEYIPNKNNLLFCRENGDLINEGASNSAFKRFCKKHNITQKKSVNQHMLRHSFATRKIEGGLPAEILKVIMGHRDIETTLNTYVNVFNEYKNVYDEKTYNYYELNGLTFDLVDKSYIIMQELNIIIDKLNNSHLEESDKKQILEIVNNINNQYKIKECKEAKQDKIITFPTLIS